MKREKYIMPVSEIQALVAGFVQYGPQETYIKMRSKALMVMDKAPALDEEFLDRAEILLQKAREEPDSVEEGKTSLKDIYYTLSFMLRRLAHEMHFIYIKKGKSKENNRFLQVISNTDGPKLLI